MCSLYISRTKDGRIEYYLLKIFGQKQLPMTIMEKLRKSNENILMLALSVLLHVSILNLPIFI